MNNYKFWEDYNKNLKIEILKKCRKKKELYIDFHIHSNYSSDGRQSLTQIIDSTRKKGFDIIAITDHDTVCLYDELYEMVKNGFTNPLIIPGIEFTMDNKKYGNQCHLLQLFINPKDEEFLKNVLINYNAMFDRSKIQFQRLKYNDAIQEILKNKKIKISYKEYITYLYDNDLVPEYDTLSFYLIDKFKSVSVTTFDVLNLLEKYNKQDVYKDRKKLKDKRYKELRLKYEFNEQNKYNSRFLLSMLAVREVDDDWWQAPSSGSLSVNSYGQMHISELNNKYKIFFAHPTEKSLNVVENIIKNKRSIIGLEKNIRNKYEDINNFYNLANNMNLYTIIGSDSHDNSLKYYEDMEYFKIDSNSIKEIIKNI